MSHFSCCVTFIYSFNDLLILILIGASSALSMPLKYPIIVDRNRNALWDRKGSNSATHGYIHAIFFRPPVGQRVNTHSVFWEFCRKPCQHATRGCDKRWMTCIHAGVSRSPREHASVPPDKRHCRQWMSSLFCGFLPNPFIHDLFCWSSRHKFVKTDL